MRFAIAVMFTLCTCAYPAPSNYPNDTSVNAITGIEIIVPSREFAVGDDIPATCVALYADGIRKTLSNDAVQWESSDQQVCAIVENKPRAAGKGRALLYAHYESFSEAKSISVIAPPDYSKILIGEVYYDPAQLADAEFIEVWNTSDEDIDIRGCSISEGGGLYSWTFPADTIISAYGKIVLPRNSESFFQEFKFYPELPSSNITLGNSGETVILKKPDGSIIDIVFLEGGDVKYPQPIGWCASNLPNAPKGYSATRVALQNSSTCADWDVRQPTPGE